MPSSSKTHSNGSRPRTTALGAFLEGWRRTIRAPYLVLGVLSVTIVISLPLAAMLRSAMSTHLGSSLAAESAIGGWNAEWADEFASGQTGVGRSFTHEILGFGGTLSVLSRLVEGRSLPGPLMGAVAAYLVVWIFLSGGIIDRLARARPTTSAMFLSTCGRFFGRLARLGLIAGLGYAALWAGLRPLLLDVLLPLVTGESAPDTYVVAWRAAAMGIFLVALGLFTLAIDLARVRLVVEDRHSVIGALGAGARFARRRAGRLGWLFLLNLLGLLVLARLWLQVAPSADTATWLVVLVSQVYLVARIWARLAFIGSEVVFFQGELAHATYTAPPPAAWPESASVEALRNLRPHQAPGP